MLHLLALGEFLEEKNLSGPKGSPVFLDMFETGGLVLVGGLSKTCGLFPRFTCLVTGCFTELSRLEIHGDFAGVDFLDLTDSLCTLLRSSGSSCLTGTTKLEDFCILTFVV